MGTQSPDVSRNRIPHRQSVDSHGRHGNFVHLVLTEDRKKALAEQHDSFSKVMSSAPGPECLEKVYLFGTPGDIVESLQARVNAVVQPFILHTMTPDPKQPALGSPR